jgi:hypothetical protein
MHKQVLPAATVRACLLLLPVSILVLRQHLNGLTIKLARCPRRTAVSDLLQITSAYADRAISKCASSFTDFVAAAADRAQDRFSST